MGNNISHESNKNRLNKNGENDEKPSNEHLTPAQKLAQSEVKGMTRSASGADIQEQRYGHFMPIEKLAKVSVLIDTFAQLNDFCLFKLFSTRNCNT